jgi:hypothetical protein|nr:MAG TPA: hypothetical protein [Caudoviricetes sp.]
MTRDEIILAAECCIADNCGACPFINRGNCITDFMKNVLECIKQQICQAYDTVDEACADIIDIYEVMSEREHRAFNIGEAYGKICSTKCKLEGLIGASGREGE